MWPYVNGEQIVAVLDYRDIRGAAAPGEFLNGVKFGTYFITDCYSSYNDSVKKILAYPDGLHDACAQGIC